MFGRIDVTFSMFFASWWSETRKTSRWGPRAAPVPPSERYSMTLDRRDFLKYSALAVAATSGMPGFLARAATQPEATPWAAETGPSARQRG